MRTRVKVCGLTRPQDVQAAVAAGVDGLGFVFCARSPRNLTLASAAALIADVPALVSTVALFMDPELEQVQALLDTAPVSLLQFHGSECAAFCESFGHPYIKAVAMGGAGVDVGRVAVEHPRAAGFLLDGNVVGQRGGLGDVFDWTRIPPGFDRPLILAGGLSPDNVRLAVACHHPYAVDVSSGVESSPGVKDPERIAAFMREVQHGSDVERNGADA